MARSVATFVALVSLLGCGGSGDDGLIDRPFVVAGLVEGSVAGEPAVEVGLLWVTGGSGCLDASARARAGASAPGTFRLVVTRTPPAEAQFITAIAEHPPVARAYVVAIREGARVDGYAANPDRVVYGLFYAKGEVPGNDAGLGLYGGTALRPGYQLGFFERGDEGSGLRLAGGGEMVQIAIQGTAAGPLYPACSAR